MALHQGRKRWQLAYYAGVLVGTGDGFMHNIYAYTLYLRCEDAILAILCTGLPIITTITGK